MKLHTKKIVAFENRYERSSMVTHRHGSTASVHCRVGMREIEIRIAGHAFQEYGIAHTPQLVPAHVRELCGRRQRLNLLRKNSEAGVSRRLSASVEKCL